MSTIITPNMNLIVPVVGVEPGPQYASDLNASLTLIDQHNHTPGFGELIPPSGLNINADLPFNSNNATLLRSVRFVSQSAPLALVTDLDCLYVSNGQLYYNDASGNQIKITNNGAVNATIASLVSGTDTAQFVANQFVITQATNTPANLVAGSVLIGNNTAGSNFVTLKPVNALPSSYSLTLPQVPSTPSFLTIDTSGNITSTTPVFAGNPSGTILMYGGTSIPTGYLLCDGSSQLRSAYPTLFAAIGTAYGTVDATHFNLPQGQGVFFRGVDNGVGNDPDSATRTVQGAGGNSGDNVGSAQGWQVQSHTHFLPGGNNGAIGATLTIPANTPVSSNNYTAATGGNQTNPINIYVNYIIKT